MSLFDYQVSRDIARRDYRRTHRPPRRPAVMPEQQQESLDGLEACRVKFIDVALDEVADPPDIDDRMHFSVEAVCIGRTTERMKDGELRRTAKMRVTALAPQGGPVKPASPPGLFSVDDRDDEGDE